MAEDLYANPVTDYICQDQARAEKGAALSRGPIDIDLICLCQSPRRLYDTRFHRRADLARKATRRHARSFWQCLLISRCACRRRERQCRRFSGVPITRGRMGRADRESQEILGQELQSAHGNGRAVGFPMAVSGGFH